MNCKKPDKSSLIGIKEILDASIKKLKNFEINTVYLGHSLPFKLNDYFAHAED